MLTAGESHGPGLVVILEGLPSGLPLTIEEIQIELTRRRHGAGRGPRMRFEQDELAFVGGVRHGLTLGSPVAISIGNTEWPKWVQEMSAGPGATEKPLTAPRPGHADLAGMQKYGLDDARSVLERSSARETAARVAAGACAKALLRQIGVELLSHVVQLGDVSLVSLGGAPLESDGLETTLCNPAADNPGVDGSGSRSKIAADKVAHGVADSWAPTMDDLGRIDASPVRCFSEEVSELMVQAIKAAAKDGDSLGGVVEILAFNVPVGLGSHVQWDRRLDGLLAQALMSIQAVKGVEIGDAFRYSAARGSDAHDSISRDVESGRYIRETNRAGGVEGGMSIGGTVRARIAMKPLATLNRPVIKTVDTKTHEETVSFKERTDVTAVPAVGVVGESMMALVLASEALRKFGGDSVVEFVRNWKAFESSLT